jgi:hypothetical protein
MRPTNEQDILFDDRLLLEAAVGDKAMTISSINTNCDCDGYYANQNDEDFNPHSITASAAATD